MATKVFFGETFVQSLNALLWEYRGLLYPELLLSRADGSLSCYLNLTDLTQAERAEVKQECVLISNLCQCHLILHETAIEFIPASDWVQKFYIWLYEM